MKEEVLHLLFWWLIAQQAGIIFVRDVIMTALEHVPGVQSVHHQELAEHFEFDGAFGFPQPNKGLVDLHLSEAVLIVYTRRESINNGAGPNIILLHFQ